MNAGPSTSADDAAAGRAALSGLVEALTALAGHPVTITVTDAPTGMAFVSLTGLLERVDAGTDHVEVALAQGVGGVRLFADMVDAVTVGDGDVHVAYRAGDVTLERRGPVTPRPRAVT
jgi:hypothetical protein